MDALAQVFSAVRVRSAAFRSTEVTPAGCAWPLPHRHRAPTGGRAQSCVFHLQLVVEGAAILDTGDEVIEARAGDMVILAGNVRAWPAAQLALPRRTTRLICGIVVGDELLCRPLLAVLPPVLSMTLDADTCLLLRELLQIAVRESLACRPGADSLLAKLSETLLVQMVRSYVHVQPRASTGWLAGLRDPRVAHALALLHRQPHCNWTVRKLASAVAVSRSVLAKRFTQLVGESPMQYLIRWRLALAADMLRSTAEPIARVASRNGYDSRESFIRAFKRSFGLPPAAWRRANQSLKLA